jgi:WD40 repeat protein
LASGSWDSNIRLWDFASSKPYAVMGGSYGSAREVAFSPDGRMLAGVGWYDDSVRRWKIPAREELPELQLHREVVECVAFSTDGNTLASGSWDSAINLWESATGLLLNTLNGHLGGSLA